MRGGELENKKLSVTSDFRTSRLLLQSCEMHVLDAAVKVRWLPEVKLVGLVNQATVFEVIRQLQVVHLLIYNGVIDPICLADR